MSLKRFAALIALVLGLGLAAGSTWAQQSPEELITQVSTDVLESVKADKSIRAGDVKQVMALVDAKVMPHVNFQRMTSSAVGR